MYSSSLYDENIHFLCHSILTDWLADRQLFSPSVSQPTGLPPATWDSLASYVYLSLFKKQKTCTVFLSSSRNTSGSLGEREMLWEHKL